MAFKLPMQNRLNQNKGRFTHSGEEAAPGTPIIRKKLESGVLAEANNDGTMFVDQSVEPGSDLERHVLRHEMQHMTDMKTGKLAYDDHTVTWDGQSYPRLDGGFILYEGRKLPEGDPALPWEYRADV